MKGTNRAGLSAGERLGREIEGQVAYVPQTATLNEDMQHFRGVLPLTGLHRLKEFVQRRMVAAVDVARTKRDGCEARGQRLKRDEDDVGRVALSVADQIEPLSTCVLGSVAAQGPLAGHAGMQDRSRIRVIRFPQRRE